MKATTPPLKQIEAYSFYTSFLFKKNFFTPFVLLLCCLLAMGSGASAQSGTNTYYLDNDGDGWGTDPSITSTSTTPPTGYAWRYGDCNDSDASINPYAPEIPGNDIDENCNGQLDEPTCFIYYDNDRDGYGDPATAIALPCDEGGFEEFGYTRQGGDCNDNNPSVNPGAAEICGNGIDDNCDGVIDNCQTTYYYDGDGDGFGTDASISSTSPDPPPGYARLSGDCNDSDASINPFAPEIPGNSVDENCDGQLDEPTCFFYYDNDKDGYGDPGIVISLPCDGSSYEAYGYVNQSDDCDDNNPAVHPGTVEICGNGIDDDCDGVVDNCVYIYFYDGDGDGYGQIDSHITSTNSEPPPGYVAQGGDCDDNNPSINPGVAEICDNGIDDNCDGVIDNCVYTYYPDNDGDGYGDALNPITIPDPVPPPGYITLGGDCFDNNNSIHPGAPDICNGIDDDCDGVVDPGCVKEQLPDFTKTDIYGVSHHFYGDLAAGKAVVLEFSTGWCPFTQTVEPQISNVYDDICQGQGNVKLYDIVFEDEVAGHESDAAFGVKYGNFHNALYPVITNSQEVYNQFAYEYSLDFIPTFFVVIPDANDPAKSAVYIMVGAIDNLKDSIEHVLAAHGFPVTPPPALSISVNGSACNLPSPVTLTSNLSSGIVWSTGETTQSITVTTEGDYSLNYAAGCGTITKKVHLIKPVTGVLSSPTQTSCAGKGVITLEYDGGTPTATLQFSTDGTNWTDIWPDFYGFVANFLNPYPAGTTVYYRVHEIGSGSIDTPPCDTYSNVVQILSEEMPNSGVEITADRTDCSFPVTLTSPYPKNNIWSTGETTQSITVNSADTYYVINNDVCGEVADFIIVDQDISTWYRDADGDGYGDPLITMQACIQPNGYVQDNNDCDDSDINTHPGAPEICDGVDNNCDGQIDEGLAKTSFYRDADGDGYGDLNNSIQACAPPEGYVSNNSDCDDAMAVINPNTTWYLDADNDGYGDPNETIQNCTQPSGYVGNNIDCNDHDDNVWGERSWYKDADGDGYGNPVISTVGCSQPQGYVGDDGDCDDTDPNINPDAIWYLDADNDGYGDANSSVQNCLQPNRYVGNSNDCDDTNPNINAGTTWYKDEDGDSYGDPNVSTQACSQPAGYVPNNSDCNDANAAINPNTTWYRDADGDGYGNPNVSTQACLKPAGYVSDNTDCNDNRSTIHPGAPETCDGIDNNCNGQIDEGAGTVLYRDADGDGYGNPAISINACKKQQAGYVANNTDCDDASAAINPLTKWYKDADNDGYYTGAAITSCTSPGTGYKYTGLLGGNDCNDNDNTVYPNAPELCDGKDNNCNGTIDEGCGTFTISIDDARMNEGNKGKTNMIFNVSLSAASTKKITVQFATQNSTAIAGSDYVAKTGTLTFNAGVTKQTISIAVVGDKTAEADEAFYVNLSKAVNATIAKATGTGTIVNDDGATLNASASLTTNSNTSERSLKVSPNPATNNLLVKLFGYSGKVTIQLMDLRGKVLKQVSMQTGNLKSAQQQFDVSGVASGTYFIVATDEKGNKQSEKIVIAH